MIRNQSSVENVPKKMGIHFEKGWTDKFDSLFCLLFSFIMIIFFCRLNRILQCEPFRKLIYHNIGWISDWKTSTFHWMRRIQYAFFFGWFHFDARNNTAILLAKSKRSFFFISSIKMLDRSKFPFKEADFHACFLVETKQTIRFVH